MENQVNLTIELVKRFNVLGYPCVEGTPGYSLVCCFINSNLIKFLGTATPSEEDVELISTRNHLELTSTFYKDPIIFEINRTMEYVMINMINQKTGEELARITNYGDHVVNTVYDSKNFMEHTYDVDTTKAQIYRYKREEVVDDERTLLYDGYLQSINAKYREREAFSMTRLYPESMKPKKFVQKVKDIFSADGCVYITTSPHCLETVAFTDVIFERLEEEADKYTVTPEEPGVMLEKK